MVDRTAPLAIIVMVADGSGMAPLPLASFTENRARAITHIVREQIRENLGDALVPTPVPAPPARSGFERTGTALPPEPSARTQREIAQAQGYTGDACDRCLSFSMRRSGTCMTCDACGTTTGCS